MSAKPLRMFHQTKVLRKNKDTIKILAKIWFKSAYVQVGTGLAILEL